MLDHIQQNCPDLYEYIIAHPIEQDEGDFEGGVFGTICRSLINWQKDDDAIKFVKFECYINATAPHRTIVAAGLSGRQGKAKAPEKDMSGSITRVMCTLKQLVHTICSSEPPFVAKVKKCTASTQKTNIAIPAFSDTGSKPAVYDVDKIGSPAYVFSWRHQLFLRYNPNSLESSPHRAPNGCQGCGSVEPAHGVPACSALISVPVHARGCGHVICATGHRVSCWLCSKMVEHDALKKLRTRMRHLNSFNLTPETLKTQGYRLASGITYHGPKGAGGTPGLTVEMFDQMVVSKTWTNEKLVIELRSLGLVVSGKADALKERLRAALLLAASKHVPIIPAVAIREPAIMEPAESAAVIAIEPAAVSIIEPATVIIDDDDNSDDDSELGNQSESDNDSADNGSDSADNGSEDEIVDGSDAVVDEHGDGKVLGNDHARAPDQFDCETVKREVIMTDLKITFQRLRPHIKPTLIKPIQATAVNQVSPMPSYPQDPGPNPNPGDALGDAAVLPQAASMDVTAAAQESPGTHPLSFLLVPLHWYAIYPQ